MLAVGFFDFFETVGSSLLELVETALEVIQSVRVLFGYFVEYLPSFFVGFAFSVFIIRFWSRLL